MKQELDIQLVEEEMIKRNFNLSAKNGKKKILFVDLDIKIVVDLQTGDYQLSAIDNNLNYNREFENIMDEDSFKDNVSQLKRQILLHKTLTTAPERVY